MPYNPPHDRITDAEPLLDFASQHPLAHVVSVRDGVPDSDLIPLLAMPSDVSPTGYALIGHIARANPLADGVLDGSNVLASFGPADHYISPTWYPSKAEHHRTVPTWNYLIVHAWGSLVLHDDPKWVRHVVARLTSVMEKPMPNPWRMGQAPADYLDEMLSKIVGIEIPITRLEGRFKVSAARSEADRLGARDGVACMESGAFSDELATAMTHPPQLPE